MAAPARQPHLPLLWCLQWLALFATIPSMPDVTETLKDAAYVSIGLAVLAFQRAQVRRQELRKQLIGQRQQIEEQLSEARSQLEKLVKDLDTRFEPVRSEVEDRITELEGRLPDPARELLKQVRTIAKETEAQARKALLNSAAA